MGIVVVLIFYAIALSIAAAVCAVPLGIASYCLTRRAGTKRKLVTWTSVLFPFACVAFAGGWFVIYAFVNYEAFHRDPGLGDSWETPLPNGYALMMIDTTDQGTVYNPKTQPSNGSVISREDAVFGVRQLQVFKDHIYGARDSQYFSHIGQESKAVDAYFELNTSSKTHTEFKSFPDLEKQASSEGVTLALSSFEGVFRKYRYGWFDYLAVAILLLGPTGGFILLSWFVWKVRREGQSLHSELSIPG